MTITRIQQTKRGRYSVTVDGEFWCALHGDAYYQSGLREGQEVTPRQLEEIRLQSDTRLAVEKAARHPLPRRQHQPAALRQAAPVGGRAGRRRGGGADAGAGVPGR